MKVTNNGKTTKFVPYTIVIEVESRTDEAELIHLCSPNSEVRGCTIGDDEVILNNIYAAIDTK